LKAILQNISLAEIEKMRTEMERVWRVFSYSSRGLAPNMILKMLARRKTPYHIRRKYRTL